ncbi:MAG: acetolactate synthase small subunit [Spirochaetaceae bacterium]|nr:acetolactate synthase small subunit [Spirochaetaceae bacterium]
MKHILSIVVRNKPGVMSHVSGLFTRRGYNIDSIAVGVTHEDGVSVITIVLRGDDQVLTQFQGQLLKLADVIEVRTLPYHDSVIRELILIRVSCKKDDRTQIFGIVEVFHGRIQEIMPESMLIEMQGSPRQVNSLLTMLEPFGIMEVARTGQIALPLQTEMD